MKAKIEQEAIRRKGQLEKEAARVTREKAELKDNLYFLETQMEVEEAVAETCILEYDGNQSLSDLSDKTEDTLQRVQDFVNKRPVPTAINMVKEVT